MATDKKRIITFVSFFLGILIITALSIGAVVMNQSNAKFVEENETSYSARLQDYDVGFVLEYTSGTTEHSITTSDLSDNHGILRLTVAEYETLKMNITYTGEGACYCRFKITESWQHTDTATGKEIITPKELSAYTLHSNLYDNRSDDGYIYCTELLKGTSRSFTAITSCTAGADAADLISPDDAAQFVDISLELEAAQWNKAADLWELQKLPWE